MRKRPNISADLAVTTSHRLTKLWPEYGKSSLPGPFDMLLSRATRFERGCFESKGVT